MEVVVMTKNRLEYVQKEEMCDRVSYLDVRKILMNFSKLKHT